MNKTSHLPSLCWPLALTVALACPACSRSTRPTSTELELKQMASSHKKGQQGGGGSATAELDWFMPPEITNSPMPGGMAHLPDAPVSATPATVTLDDPQPQSIPPTANPATAPNPATVPARSGDWPQWGGAPSRDKVATANTIPEQWNVGQIDPQTGQWIPDEAQHVQWVARLGSQTYGTPVVAGGHILVATNNGGGYLQRYPAKVDLGCLLCFAERDGAFLWQHSNEKLASGPANDWPDQGVCCAPLVEQERVWYVSNRGEVVCLDLLGFRDGEDDGPIRGARSRLFTVRPPRRESEPNPVAALVADLDQARLSEGIRSLFADAGQPLPDDAQLATDQAGGAWSVRIPVGQNDRDYRLAVIDGELSCDFTITVADVQEADVVWRLDMMNTLGVRQHNMASCCVTAYGDVLFVNTSNGVDEATHVKLPAPDAPSFIALNKHTGEVYWKDNSPGTNILHGQWSSPAVGVIGGVPQVVFAAGDGWVYSFQADQGQDGKPTLLWKFDTNPKQTRWTVGGTGDRNNIIATPVIHQDRVYIANGTDPEYGEGPGQLWCIDGTGRGDISAQLAVRADDHATILPPRRVQAVIADQGEEAIANPQSAAVWGYRQQDANGNGEIEFEEELHRTLSMVAIHNNLLLLPDHSGLLHCLDARTGKRHWTFDLMASVWGSPLIVNDRVYMADEDGDVAIFKLSAEPQEPLSEINMGDSIYSTPIVANGTLYIATRAYLYAIGTQPE